MASADTLAMIEANPNVWFHWGNCSLIVGPKGGRKRNITEVRRNGMVKTWKTRPGQYSIPFKYGLRECFYITHDNYYMIHLPQDCPVRWQEWLLDLDDASMRNVGAPVDRNHIGESRLRKLFDAGLLPYEALTVVHSMAFYERCIPTHVVGPHRNECFEGLDWSAIVLDARRKFHDAVAQKLREQYAEQGGEN